MSSRRSNLATKQKSALFTAGLAIVATTMVALLSACNSFQATVSPENQTAIEYVGHIMDATTLQPISNAKITLTLKGVPPVVYTDSEGVYRFNVAIQSDVSGQLRVDAQGYRVYIRNITISPTVDRIEDIRLFPMEAMLTGTSASDGNGMSTITPTSAVSNAVLVVNDFYSTINDAQNKDDFRKAWELETSGPNGLQCREASRCQYSEFQDSWWLWKVQYKLYDCGSNLVDAELRFYRRDPGMATASLAPIYLRYELVDVAGELKIDKGQKIGAPGIDCILMISVP